MRAASAQARLVAATGPMRIESDPSNRAVPENRLHPASPLMRPASANEIVCAWSIRCQWPSGWAARTLSAPQPATARAAEKGTRHLDSIRMANIALDWFIVDLRERRQRRRPEIGSYRVDT